MAFHLGLEFLVIFNYSVMNTDYKRFNLTRTRSRTVTRYMGMCIGLAGFAVSRPSCVAYTACAGKRFAVVGLLGKILKPSDRLYDLGLFVTVSYGYTRRIISAVFKFCQSRQQYGSRLFVTYISNYSAHKNLFLYTVL